MENLISIIVPMFNAEKYIERCIKSVINQTADNWELILIDDGSIDDTSEICYKYLDNKKIHLYIKKNTGVSDTRNFGIDRANGNWITFLDADDELSCNYIENAIKIINESDYDIIIGEIYTSIGQKFVVKEDVKYNINNKEELIKNIITSKNLSKFYDSKLLGYAAGKIFKKSVIKKVRFSKEIKFREDMLFNLNAFINAFNILLTNKLSYNYIININSASFNYIGNYADEIKKFRSILENIVVDCSANIKSAFYICMINMYVNWLKLCIMHKKSQFTQKEKLREIKNSFSDNFWKEIFNKVNFKELTNQYKILYVLYKLKLKRLIFLIVTINMRKNNKIYNV